MGTLRDLTGQTAANNAAAQARDAGERARQDAIQFREGGTTALKRINALQAGEIDLFAQPGVMKSFNSGADAIQRKLAAQGYRGSGNELLALADYTGSFSRGLYNDFFSQNMGLATMGANAAVGAGSNLVGAYGHGVTGAGYSAQSARAGFEGLMDLGGMAAGFFGFSDRRLKENIEQVGKFKNGIGIYVFNYIGSDETVMGVMADEVEKVIPEAVITHSSGYKMVNYGAL